MASLRAEQIRDLRMVASNDPKTAYEELATFSNGEILGWLHESTSLLGRDPSTLLGETIAVAAHGVRDPVVVRHLVADLLEEIQTTDRPNHSSLQTIALLSETRPELLREAVDPLCDLLGKPRERTDHQLRQDALITLRNVVYANKRVRLTSAQVQSILDHCTAAPTLRERGLALGVVRAAIELQALPRESVRTSLEVLSSPDGESLAAEHPTLVIQTIDALTRTYPAELERTSMKVEQFLERTHRAEIQSTSEALSAPATGVSESPSQNPHINLVQSQERSVVKILRQYVPAFSVDIVSTEGASAVVEALKSGDVTTEILATLWRPGFWCELDRSIENGESGTEITESTDLTRLPGVGDQLAQRLRDNLSTATSGPVTVRDVQEASPAALEIQNIQATRYRTLKRGRFQQTLLALATAFYENGHSPHIDLTDFVRVVLTAATVNPTSVQHVLDASVGAVLETLPRNTATQNRTTLLRLTDLFELIHTTTPHLTSDVVAGIWHDTEPRSNTWRNIVNPDTADQQRWAIGLLAHLVTAAYEKTLHADHSVARVSALATVYRKRNLDKQISSELAILLRHESAKEATAILAGLSGVEIPKSFDLRTQIRDTFEV